MLNNVDSTSMQRYDVALTLRQRCINVMCVLGGFALFYLIWILTFTTVLASSADDIIMIFHPYFSEEIGVEVSYKLSHKAHKIIFCCIYKNYIYIYHIAMNIKWFKYVIKAKELACWYHMMLAHLLDIAYLLGCLLILPLHYVAFDDVIMQWCHAKPCHTYW